MIGKFYRDKVIEAADNMNSQIASVTVTYRDSPRLKLNPFLLVPILMLSLLRHVEKCTNV